MKIEELSDGYNLAFDDGSSLWINAFQFEELKNHFENGEPIKIKSTFLELEKIDENGYNIKIDDYTIAWVDQYTHGIFTKAFNDTVEMEVEKRLKGTTVPASTSGSNEERLFGIIEKLIEKV